MTINYHRNNYGTNIKLVEGDEILNGNEKIAEELKNVFKNGASNINIEENSVSQSKEYHNLNTIQAFH